MDTPLDVLAFSPHPDDAELGCGGSSILASNEGLRVAIADLSAGEMSSRGTPAQRRLEKEEAATQLGLCNRLLVGLPDSQIGNDPDHRLAVIELIRETRPRIVLAPYSQDRHPDHSAASKLIQDACFFAGVSKIGAGKPHRPERVYYYMIHQPFAPSFVVDISTVWDRKMAAIMAYKSQFAPTGIGPETAISRPSFMRVLEAKAILYGAMIGATYGEAFFLPGPVPLPQLPGLTTPPTLPGELPAYTIF